jgi:hypothetical protein
VICVVFAGQKGSNVAVGSVSVGMGQSRSRIYEERIQAKN